MRGIFVTGTDTGVGKTVVCAALVHAFREKGIDAGYMKPVATGCALVEDRIICPDVEFVAKACGLDDDLDTVNPVSFTPPVDPLSASAMVGEPVDTGRITAAFEELSERHEFLVVEGIGGIAVPIGAGFDVCGLIALLSLPAIVVMRPDLGTINHTVLTVDYARRRGVGVLGLVVNSPSGACRGPSARTGPAAAAEILGLPVIAEIGHDPEIAASPDRSIRRLAAQLAGWVEVVKDWN